MKKFSVMNNPHREVAVINATSVSNLREIDSGEGRARWLARERAAAPEASLEEIEQSLPEDAFILTSDSDDWPSALRLLARPPELLSAQGDVSLAERDMLVSIVGSRRAGPERRAAAREGARTLAERGAVVVSGLAAGIDRAAHEGALEVRGGRTIAVMGTPLAAPWPPENAALAAEIAARGLILSDAPQFAGLDFTPEERAESLRARNRIVAAIGLGSLVMAADTGSSTLIEARAALEIERPVLLWSGALEDSGVRELLLEASGLEDRSGRKLLHVVSNALEVDAALSPWRGLWWL